MIRLRVAGAGRRLQEVGGVPSVDGHAVPFREAQQPHHCLGPVRAICRLAGPISRVGFGRSVGTRGPGTGAITRARLMSSRWRARVGRFAERPGRLRPCPWRDRRIGPCACPSGPSEFLAKTRIFAGQRGRPPARSTRPGWPARSRADFSLAWDRRWAAAAAASRSSTPPAASCSRRSALARLLFQPAGAGDRVAQFGLQPLDLGPFNRLTMPRGEGLDPFDPALGALEEQEGGRLLDPNHRRIRRRSRPGPRPAASRRRPIP